MSRTNSRDQGATDPGDALIAAFVDGITQLDLWQQFRVYTRILTLAAKQIPAARRAVVADLVSAGYSQADIASRVGLGRSAISHLAPPRK